MPDLALDLRYLRFALAAAEHGGFWQTAMALDVSQSMYATTSRAISSSTPVGFQKQNPGNPPRIARVFTSGCGDRI
jgi:hypothetical protein